MQLSSRGLAMGLGMLPTLTSFGGDTGGAVIHSSSGCQARICDGSRDPVKMHGLLFRFDF